MITDQEANALCLLVQKGAHGAANRLLKACEPYMQTLVNQNRGKFPLPNDELLQEARTAFWEASKTFSPQLGRFLPYAAKKASWAFQRAYKACSEIIHLPDTTLRRKTPSNASLKALQVKTAWWAPRSEDDDESYEREALVDYAPSVLDWALEEETLAKVWDVLPQDERKRELVIRHFGLRTGVPMPLEALGPTKQAAHMMLHRELFKMRVALRSHTFRQKTKRRPNAEL